MAGQGQAANGATAADGEVGFPLLTPPGRAARRAARRPAAPPATPPAVARQRRGLFPAPAARDRQPRPPRLKRPQQQRAAAAPGTPLRPSALTWLSFTHPQPSPERPFRCCSGARNEIFKAAPGGRPAGVWFNVGGVRAAFGRCETFCKARLSSSHL